MGTVVASGMAGLGEGGLTGNGRELRGVMETPFLDRCVSYAGTRVCQDGSNHTLVICSISPYVNHTIVIQVAFKEHGLWSQADQALDFSTT